MRTVLALGAFIGFIAILGYAMALLEIWLRGKKK